MLLSQLGLSRRLQDFVSIRCSSRIHNVSCVFRVGGFLILVDAGLMDWGLARAPLGGAGRVVALTRKVLTEFQEHDRVGLRIGCKRSDEPQDYKEGETKRMADVRPSSPWLHSGRLRFDNNHRTAALPHDAVPAIHMPDFSGDAAIGSKQVDNFPGQVQRLCIPQRTHSSRGLNIGFSQGCISSFATQVR